MISDKLDKFDPDVYALIKDEEARQQNKLAMIASENFTIPAVREALGSVFVHKYAEGMVNKRYYEGNQFVDKLEKLCEDRLKELFALSDEWDVNVQPLSGSNANLAVYNGLLTPGDKILSMYLPDGGHLSHGWSIPGKDEGGLSAEKDNRTYRGGGKKVSIVSKVFEVLQYKVDPESRLFDMDSIAEIAREYRPKIIISGGTSYARNINYEAFSRIAKEVGAYYLADVSHEAGLIAAGANPSPVGWADVVTFTTHKTLRGARAAAIITRKELIDQIDFAVFPGLQGGPFQHSIAAIAVALKDAMSPQFREYGRQVVANAQCLAKRFAALGYDVVSGGTDKHMVLLDLRKNGLNGTIPALALDRAGIVLNKNSVPNETGSPANPSGLRIGTPTITSRGMKEAEIDQIAAMIDRVIKACKPYSNMKKNEFIKEMDKIETLTQVEKEAAALCSKFPLPV